MLVASFTLLSNLQKTFGHLTNLHETKYDWPKQKGLISSYILVNQPSLLFCDLIDNVLLHRGTRIEDYNMSSTFYRVIYVALCCMVKLHCHVN